MPRVGGLLHALCHVHMCLVCTSAAVAAAVTQVDEVVQQVQRCAQSLAGLVELTKKHKTRNQLLGTALKYGGGFLDVMVKASDFWFAYYMAYGRPFQQLVKTIQKATKIMQASREGSAEFQELGRSI